MPAGIRDIDTRSDRLDVHEPTLSQGPVRVFRSDSGTETQQ
jgi:hypothetical protein